MTACTLERTLTGVICAACGDDCECVVCRAPEPDPDVPHEHRGMGGFGYCIECGARAK